MSGEMKNDRDAACVAEPTQASAPFMPGSYDPRAPATGHGSAPVASQHPTTPTDDVIDVQAVARLLHVGRNTVYALVSRNQIPHRRLGKQIRFHQAAVMRWLDSWSSQGAKERQ
jgi:excisionase family DNA binding protein